MRTLYASGLIVICVCAAARAGQYELLTGVDVQRYPGSFRPNAPGPFFDGDRLAGTSDLGPPVAWQGNGTPMLSPNNVGAMSFLFRRGRVPFGPALMGIDFLGGPLLDLDGDLNNGTRSLVPVTGQTPVQVPGSSSYLDLRPDFAAGTLTLDHIDATGTNEGGPSIDPEFGVTLLTIAGTNADGLRDPGGPNPTFDTRTGTLTPHVGPGGPLAGVYRIENLPIEMWYDSISLNSGTPNDLGTLQHFAELRGWLVRRDCATGQFPMLAGQALGSNLWPAIDTTHVGHTFNTTFGQTRTITDGVTGDVYSAFPNGTDCPDFSDDLGAYLDNVVVPRVNAQTPGAKAFVYLESAAFGINNSGDPVFRNTNGYDAVLIAALRLPNGDMNGDGALDGDDVALFTQTLLDPDGQSPETRENADLNGDCDVNGLDVQPFVDAVL